MGTLGADNATINTVLSDNDWLGAYYDERNIQLF